MRLHKRNLFIIVFAFLICNILDGFSGESIKLFADAEPLVWCHDANILKGIKVLAAVITIIKVLVPALLIVTSIKAMFNAVLDQDDANIKTAAFMFIKKFIAGAIIFFIPTIVHAIMSAANGYDKTNTQFSECGKCLTSIKDCNSLIKQYTK